MKFSKIATIITAMVMLLSFGVFAQSGPIDKGSMMLAGGFQYASMSGDLYENIDGDAVTFMNFYPTFSYFVIPSLAIGINLNLQSFSSGDVSESALGFGPHVMYFFDLKKDVEEPKGKIYPYFSAGFFFMSSSFDGGEGTEEIKYSGTKVAAAGGITYMITNAVSAYGELDYNIDSHKQTDPIESESADGNVLGFEVGVRAFIF